MAIPIIIGMKTQGDSSLFRRGVSLKIVGAVLISAVIFGVMLFYSKGKMLMDVESKLPAATPSMAPESGGPNARPAVSGRLIESDGTGQISVAHSTQGYGTLQYDKTVMGAPLNIGGRRFLRGLGTHAYSKIALKLQTGFDTFSGFCGIDDEVGPPPRAVFKIMTGRKVLFTSPITSGRHRAIPFSINVAGTTDLTLIVEGESTGHDPDAGVHGDWADLRLE